VVVAAALPAALGRGGHRVALAVLALAACARPFVVSETLFVVSEMPGPWERRMGASEYRYQPYPALTAPASLPPELVSLVPRGRYTTSCLLCRLRTPLALLFPKAYAFPTLL